MLHWTETWPGLDTEPKYRRGLFTRPGHGQCNVNYLYFQFLYNKEMNNLGYIYLDLMRGMFFL